MTTETETVTLDDEEVAPSELTFISLVGDGLVIQHRGWAQEELQGPGGLEPDPIEFGSTQTYTPRNAVEARELLEHHHRKGNPGGQDWFCLTPREGEMPEPSEEALDEIPDGYAKVDGELVPVEELLAESANGAAEDAPDVENTSESQAPSGEKNGSAESDGALPSDVSPLTAEGEEEITTKQDAVEALAAEGVDFSGEDAPSPGDKKEEIVAYAHQQGYYFPNYE